jgi:hypothetical protein
MRLLIALCWWFQLDQILISAAVARFVLGLQQQSPSAMLS